MMNIPLRFDFAAEFGDEKISSVNLSALVKSYLEREIREQRNDGDNVFDDDENDEVESKFEYRDIMENLVGNENDAVKRRINAEVEKAYGEIGSSPEFKRRLVARLRHGGFDAGLCKSKWEKNSRRPPGHHEYIDVNAAGNRYIIELNFAGEFTIARPIAAYSSLLEVCPQIFVGKSEQLKPAVRLMCTAVKKSMKSTGMPVPPWRRHAYMRSKWFEPYDRITDEIAGLGGDLAGNKRFEFFGVKKISFHCREELGGGARMGNLTMAFNQKKMLL